MTYNADILLILEEMDWSSDVESDKFNFIQYYHGYQKKFRIYAGYKSQKVATTKITNHKLSH